MRIIDWSSHVCSSDLKVKLGSWQHFLAMRPGVLDLNEQFRDLLSNDLGAIGGLLFDIGSGRYHAPHRDEGDQAAGSWAAGRDQARSAGSDGESGGEAGVSEGTSRRTREI